MSGDHLVTELEGHFRRVGTVELTETTKSWLFITSDRVFKLKKRVRDDLQDLTFLRARHDNTLTEMDLNRRLAPTLYLDAVRVGRMPAGRVVLDDSQAETVDWLVQMRRLPQDRMLDALIIAGASKDQLAAYVDDLIPVLSAFYRHAGATRLTGQDLLTVQEDQLAMARDVLLHPRFAEHHARFVNVLGRIDDL